MNRKLTKETLRALYPAPSQDFAARTSAMLRSLPRQSTQTRGRKKLALGLALAAALTLSAIGALAAALDWNVMDFLFSGRMPGDAPENPETAALVQAVNAAAGDGRVTLRVTGALTDGEVIAFDWRIENEQPGEPVFVAVESFTGNGERLATDGADGFDCQWLPGAYSEGGAMQGGELIGLPPSVQGADALDVAMTVAVYRPLVPVWDLGPDCDPGSLDPAPILEHLAAGGVVTGMGDGFAVPDGAQGVCFVVRGVPDELRDRFERTAFTLTFSLDLQAGRARVRDLQPMGDMSSARYTKASVSPLGLKLEMDLFDFDPHLAFDLVLTDEDGAPLDAPWPEGEITTETAQDGSLYHHARFAWYGLTEDALPDVISLTRFDREGNPSVHPVRVR